MQPSMTDPSDGPSKCIFYDLNHSNNAARIRLWLRIKGIPDDLVERRLVSMEDLRHPDYAKIHPGRKVPALTIAGCGRQRQLFEASVIMGYLEDRFGGPTQTRLVLADASPDDRAFVHLLVRCHDLYIASPNCHQPNFSHTQGCMYLDPTPTLFTPACRTMDAATRAAKLKELHQQLVWLESQVRLPYLAGGQLTHADLTWFPTIVFMEFMLPRSFGWPDRIFYDPTYLPQITAWYQHCLNDAQFQLVREEILEDHKEAYQRGRLSGVQQDVQSHPEFQWHYL